eukprot:TRINITY_DN8579_c0_g1_i1.p1 TRINITY_DN8579_c0_g1~~TRINITY_DN8579_c0_g1_i1.p1  ORF type:complete len:563 (+),score=110.72 TRINITY_DN8579_c0_g1_i1:49-1737(+)
MQMANPLGKFYFYGVHDCTDGDIADALASFKATGELRKDYAALCSQAGRLPHPALVPVKPADEQEDDAALPPEGPAFIVQAQLFDLASLDVLRHVVPTAHHLTTIRLSGCQLDVESLALLSSAFTESCTVHTFHLDWNPLKLPIDASRADEIAVGGGTLEELDELERQAEKQQLERELRRHVELLILLEKQHQKPPEASAQGGSRPNSQAKGRSPSPNPHGSAGDSRVLEWKYVQPLLNRLASAASDFAATSMLEPLDRKQWIRCFREILGLPERETGPIFDILDQSPYGPGDGYLPLVRLELALQAMKKEEAGAESGEDDKVDPIGAAFGSFFDAQSPLEVVSLRSCALGRAEVAEMSRGLKLSRTLKALNLWGNRLCDRALGHLAEALEGCAPWHGLQYLGLGCNLITHYGLQRLCIGSLGGRLIHDKKEADEVKKEIGSQGKERDKIMKKPEPPRVDANGRERYRPDFCLDLIEDHSDPVTGQPVWIHYRNTVLKTLNLEDNLVANTDIVQRLQPLGASSGVEVAESQSVQSLVCVFCVYGAPPYYECQSDGGSIRGEG